MSLFRDPNSNPTTTAEFHANQEWRHKCDREIRVREKKICESAKRHRARCDAGLPFDDEEEDEDEDVGKGESGGEYAPSLDDLFDQGVLCAS